MRFRNDAQRKAVMAKLNSYNPQIRLPTINKQNTKFLKPSERTGYSFFDYDLSQAKKIGVGRDRTVYELPDGKLIKIAKNPIGLQQNDQAGDYLLKELMPELYESGKDYIIVEKVEYNPKKSYGFMRYFDEFTQKDFDDKNDKLQDTFRQLEDKYDVPFTTLLNYDLAWGDFIRQKNWGWRNNKPVLIDEGVLNIKMLNAPYHKEVRPDGKIIIDTIKDYPATKDWKQVISQRKLARKKGLTVITNGK